MAKKLLLEYEDENPYFYIGISSSIKDYQMIFDLNKHLSLKFKHVDAFHFKTKKKEFVYSLYTFIDNANLINYYLISNKDKTNRLVPTFKHLDFFMIVEGEIDDAQIDELARNIKQLPRVLFSSQLEAENFEKIKGLRYEFDMHLEKVLSII
jgi:hypothetical protein